MRRDGLEEEHCLQMSAVARQRQRVNIEERKLLKREFYMDKHQSIAEGMYWNKAIETASATEIQQIQLERLQKIVQYVSQSNRLYKTRFDRQGLEPANIRTLEDIRLLPFMGKADLEEDYPFGYCCVSRDRIREIHLSSGSTGKPVVMFYTEEDLDQWATCMARCYNMAGLGKGTVLQITPSFGLFNGGFGFYHGARKAGFFVIPAGPGNTLRQIQLANDFRADAIAGVASYGIRIMEVMREKGIKITSLKKGLFGAEVASREMKKRLQREMGIEVFDIYGMTETGGVGTTGMDCHAHDGIHVWEDHYLVEVVDPDTGQPMADGQRGELVFTSLTRTAFPVIRFRSGDLSRIKSRSQCECGRTHLRIDYIEGRVDDMLIIKGVNFFPAQVEEVLMSIPGVREQYRIVLTERDGAKDAYLEVEVEEGIVPGRIERELRQVLGFSLDIKTRRPGELRRSAGKARRVIRLGDPEE